MSTASAGRDALAVLRAWLHAGIHILRLSAQVLVLALSPASYRAAQRPLLARHLYLGTAPLLLWFTVMSSLIGLVVIRIVTVTAASYGLSQYALQMVVRVLVLELIPLTAAVFVALRVALPNAADVGALRADGRLDLLRPDALRPGTPAEAARRAALLACEVLPRALAAAFAVVALAAVSGVVTLVLAYLSVYGFAAGGMPHYSRTVGHVFHPVVTLIFVAKTALLALAVALIPLGSALYDGPRRVPRGPRSSAEIRVLVRLFLVILLIEAVSLVGNYA